MRERAMEFCKKMPKLQSDPLREAIEIIRALIDELDEAKHAYCDMATNAAKTISDNSELKRIIYTQAERIKELEQENEKLIYQLSNAADVGWTLAQQARREAFERAIETVRDLRVYGNNQAANDFNTGVTAAMKALRKEMEVE